MIVSFQCFIIVCYRKSNLFKLVEIKRRLLIYIIIQPVCNKEMCVAAPCERRGFRMIIVRKVVIGNLWIDALINVAEIFFGECVAIIFGVTCHKELSAALFSNDMKTGKIGNRERDQFVVLLDIVQENFRVTGMRGILVIVEAAHQGMIRI